MREPKSPTWFAKFGWFHYPVSWQGFVVYLLGIAFMVHIFFFEDSVSLSVSDTLYGVFPYWVPTFLLMEFVASQNCRH